MSFARMGGICRMRALPVRLLPDRVDHGCSPRRVAAANELRISVGWLLSLEYSRSLLFPSISCLTMEAGVVIETSSAIISTPSPNTHAPSKQSIKETTSDDLQESACCLMFSWLFSIDKCDHLQNNVFNKCRALTTVIKPISV